MPSAALHAMLSDMPDQQEKVRENRLRRMAIRQGIELRKCQRRDRLALDHGLWSMTWLRTHQPFTDGYELTSDQVERYLTRDPDTYNRVANNLINYEYGGDPDPLTDREVMREYLRITRRTPHSRGSEPRGNN